MRQQILSCVLQNNRKINISFALANFQTSVEPSSKSQLDKPIGYCLMCQFWTYDVFYHPAIIQGNYDYLMRMDDDSYFISSYEESFDSMHPILQRFLNKNSLQRGCIYNNFFVIRLKWYYESKRV
ncbi:unnamed protein product [Rotaria sp. Silwood1]|nr:unnamed protein product [Rotaria sp. Silwood1]CAF1003689.1 unnamed protein product [Rotaria sp. Silwood1]CAF3421236.1 unnamed protein product [Rotaria sp. Silwood1]CAF4775131.1 unnamed protein product [Rotaria sp. Silwood1]